MIRPFLPEARYTSRGAHPITIHCLHNLCLSSTPWTTRATAHLRPVSSMAQITGVRCHLKRLAAPRCGAQAHLARTTKSWSQLMIPTGAAALSCRTLLTHRRNESFVHNPTLEPTLVDDEYVCAYQSKRGAILRKKKRPVCVTCNRSLLIGMSPSFMIADNLFSRRPRKPQPEAMPLEASLCCTSRGLELRESPTPTPPCPTGE